MKLVEDKSKVLILSHFLINPTINAATSTMLRNFLLDKVEYVVQIEQPFLYSKHKYSYVLKYKNNKLLQKHKFKTFRSPMFMAYFSRPFVALYFAIINFKIFDIAIACENLSFVTIFILKKLGVVKYTVYYSVDYVEERFENKLLNRIYHFLDRLAVYNSDVNWVVSKEQISAREKNGINISKSAPFKIVPIGFESKDIKILPTDKIDFYNLIFCGTLRESAGPQLAISALPLILKKFPKAHITFVGGGDKSSLVTLAKKLKIANKIKFFQNISDHSKLVKILSKGSIGLAPYAPVPISISYTSDPGKIKLYLLCGLPVITTKIATSNKLITRNKSGITIKYDEKELAKAVVRLLSNKNKYKIYKNNVVKLREQFDIDNIFKKALY